MDGAGSLTQLSGLTTLQLRSNLLEDLPIELSGCPSLHTLDLCMNKVVQLPPCILHMSALRKLFLSFNTLRHAPLEVESMPHLQFVELCCVCCEPEEQAKLKALQQRAAPRLSVAL